MASQPTQPSFFPRTPAPPHPSFPNPDSLLSIGSDEAAASYRSSESGTELDRLAEAERKAFQDYQEEIACANANIEKALRLRAEARRLAQEAEEELRAAKQDFLRKFLREEGHTAPG